MKFRTLCVGAVLAAVSTFAAAQGTPEASFPSRPIRMIAPSSSGGPVDVMARVVAQGLSEVLGQQVVVDNRAGAAGLIGAELVATAIPDGYTIMFGFSGPLVIVPHLGGKTPYNTLKDFAPVSFAIQGPYILLVRPSLPVNSVKDLIAAAKQQPGKLNYASGGNGTGIHLAGELFKMTAGVNIVHVPYKGAGPGMTALLANEVDMMFNGLAPAIPHVKSGKLKGLAVGGTKRSTLLPELPTVAEASGLDFNTTGWYGILAPARTPRAIVMKLHAATVKALATPAVRDTLARQGVESVGSTPEEFAKLIRDEWSKWEKVIKTAGLKGQT
ncbi:MAG TPA: tripartite tricarboxylate transporter substrate binding protein [Burkholderiales bacterium]|nr:tripartite tricarboxylate transporter substrate binding protein [Burkholderiales bacterium]